MNRNIAGLLGAAAALTTATAAFAATPTPTELPSATSYRDLLTPVPNAMAALRADDARLANAPTREMKLAQAHHHHHHHNPPPRRHHHHHHND
jgi:hypothetical protein